MHSSQGTGHTNITVIGTCLHPEALLSELLENPAWQASRYQAVIAYATRQDLWAEYTRLLTNLADKERLATAYRFYKAQESVMLEGAEVLWPEGEPYEYLMRVRIEEGEAAFNSEKQNEPFDPEQNLLNMKRAVRFAFEWIEQTQKLNLRWLDGSHKRVTRLRRMIAFHDPAMGKEPTQTGDPDYTAIVVLGEDEEGYLYVLDAYLRKDSPDQQVRKALELYKKWRELNFKRVEFAKAGFRRLAA